MAQTSTGAKQQPGFASTGNTPTFAADLSLVADYAAKVGNRIAGTTSERLAWPAWEGLQWYDTTLKQTFVYSSGWILTVPVALPSFSVVGTQTAVAAGTDTTLATTTSSEWTAVGFAEAAGVWTYTGPDGSFLITLFAQPNGTSGTGYIDGKVTKGGTSNVIMRDSDSGNASGFPAVHRSKVVNLANGDNIRARVNQNTGAPRDIAYEFQAVWLGVKRP